MWFKKKPEKNEKHHVGYRSSVVQPKVEEGKPKKVESAISTPTFETPPKEDRNCDRPTLQNQSTVSPFFFVSINSQGHTIHTTFPDPYRDGDMFYCKCGAKGFLSKIALMRAGSPREATEALKSIAWDKEHGECNSYIRIDSCMGSYPHHKKEKK